MKVLAVGDIHTKTWIIDLVENVIDDYDMVVFVGDYADNWGVSGAETIETWRKLWHFWLAYPDIRLVLGNHDYAYLHNVSCSGHNQLAQMLLDVPENKDLKEWLYSLPITLEIDGVTYSHAGLDERWDGKEMWDDISPMWVRPNWAQYKKIKQVVGHTPMETVTEVQPDIWLIDTFSQYMDGSPIGDGSMLVITDGETFEKINIHANNNDPTGVEGGLS
jgi:predicted MPP superfamily phosphohydrolase